MGQQGATMGKQEADDWAKGCNDGATREGEVNF